MSLNNVLIIGGNGFVGSSIANRLANLNVKVTVPTRRRERRRDLLLLPNIEQVEADVNDEATLASLVAGKDAVINLVGLLHTRDSQIGSYGRDFAQAHVELPRKIVAACRKAGVRRLLHMSALNAAVDGASEYLRSKGDGEALVMAANGVDGLDVTVFRPSVIFGVGDSFLSTFARFLRGAPVFPLGYGHAKFQPVFVGDVAECFVRSIESRDTFGKAYDLVGPQVYTLRELVDYVNGLCGNRCRIVALGEFWSLMQAGILSLLPKPPLTPDNLRSMEVDSVRADAVMPFGLTPTPLEAIAPSYILGRAPRVHYDRMRVRAGR